MKIQNSIPPYLHRAAVDGVHVHLALGRWLERLPLHVPEGEAVHGNIRLVRSHPKRCGGPPKEGLDLEAVAGVVFELGEWVGGSVGRWVGGFDAV